MNHPRCGFAAPPPGGAAGVPAKPGRGGHSAGRIVPGRATEVRRLGAVALLLVALPLAAQAELVPVAWDAQGRWQAALAIAPKQFAEACTALKQGERIRWRWQAAQPLKFNIHYHEGKAVRMPVQTQAAAGEGTLEVTLDQDYCWMWSGATAADRIAVTLERLP